MSPRKKQELDEKEEVKSTTSTKTKSRGGNDNVSLFTLAVVAIVILGLIGIVFGCCNKSHRKNQGLKLIKQYRQ